MLSEAYHWHRAIVVFAEIAPERNVVAYTAALKALQLAAYDATAVALARRLRTEHDVVSLSAKLFNEEYSHPMT